MDFDPIISSQAVSSFFFTSYSLFVSSAHPQAAYRHYNFPLWKGPMNSCPLPELEVL